MALRCLRMALCGLPMRLETVASIHNVAAPVRQASLLPRHNLPQLLSIEQPAKLQAPRISTSHRAVSSTAAEDIRQPQYDAYVWGSPDAAPTQQIAPCPICQTALLLLNEKGVRANRHYIDFNTSPTWLTRTIGDRMPAVVDQSVVPPVWVGGLPDISAYLEDAHPDPPLGVIPQELDGSSNDVDVDGLWYAFLDYLRSPAGSDELAMQELQRRLSAVKERLSGREGGPYLQGPNISAQDMCLAPRLHHILTALPYLKMQPAAEAPAFLLMRNWQLPQELLPLADYASRMRSRDSWSGTSTPNSRIVEQWGKSGGEGCTMNDCRRAFSAFEGRRASTPTHSYTQPPVEPI